MIQSRSLRRVLGIILIGCLMLGATGCGYLKNLRDDSMDCVMIGGGVVPPVVPDGQGGKRVVGAIPPSIGLYLEATNFLHLGGMYKISGDAEMDRRGLFAGVDRRIKAGFGPWHYVVKHQYPISANAYKLRGNQMDGWRAHMKELEDPIFQAPAKRLIYQTSQRQPYMYRGWQDWEMFSVEVAIPEPFILHSGLNVRLGVDPSQFFDLFLGLFTLDLYDDNAYQLDGQLRFPESK